VDAAKGLCMILVVLVHTAVRLDYEIADGVDGFWTTVNLFFNPLRMPLFFFISGFLVADAIRRPLRDTRRRTLGMAYLYVLWTAIFLTRLTVPMARGGESMPTPVEILLALVLPTSYWYLYALPVYFLLTWGLVRLLKRRSAYALIPLGILSAVSFLAFFRPRLDEPLNALMLGALCANAVWFYLGVHGKKLWLALLERATLLKLAGAVVAYVLIYTVANMTWLVPEFKVILSVAVLALSAQLFGRLPMDGRVGSLLRSIGQQTLPVYIFHLFFLAGFGALFRVLGVEDLAAAQGHPQLISAFLVPVVAAGTIFASILLGRLIARSKVSWLLEAPEWLVGKRPVRAVAQPVP